MFNYSLNFKHKKYYQNDNAVDLTWLEDTQTKIDYLRSGVIQDGLVASINSFRNDPAFLKGHKREFETRLSLIRYEIPFIINNLKEELK